LREKDGTGFPYLIFMDESGEVLAKQRERTVAGFKKSQRALALLAGLDKPNLSKDKPVAAAIYIAKLELGKFELAEATTRAKDLELDEKQKIVFDREITNLSVADLYAKARQNRDYASLGAKFVDMKKAGKIPTGAWGRNFWSQIMNFAQTKRDVKLYEEAYGKYKALLGGDKRYQRLFERYDAVLEALKNGDQIPRQRTGARRIRRVVDEGQRGRRIHAQAADHIRVDGVRDGRGIQQQPREAEGTRRESSDRR
jgi:hypothetical protein